MKMYVYIKLVCIYIKLNSKKNCIKNVCVYIYS